MYLMNADLKYSNDIQQRWRICEMFSLSSAHVCHVVNVSKAGNMWNNPQIWRDKKIHQVSCMLIPSVGSHQFEGEKMI